MSFISCLFTFYQNHAPTMSLSDKYNPFCLKAPACGLTADMNTHIQLLHLATIPGFSHTERQCFLICRLLHSKRAQIAR